MKPGKKVGTIALCFLLFLSFTKPVYATEESPVYRLYNNSSKEHLFVQDINERDSLMKDGWIYEKIAWYAPSSSSFPVYRLFNKSKNERKYTMDLDEKRKLISSGYIEEGIAWYSSESEALPIYENKESNHVHLTANFSEYSYLGIKGWDRNGIAGYGERNATKEEEDQAHRSLTYTYGYLYYVDGVLIANKKHALPSNYAPGEDPTAKAAAQRLINYMRNNGYNISTYYSGYRSYSTQATLYNNYVKADGKEAADTYSARPGHSEHQTGLAFDLCNKSYQLVESKKECDWIAAHAHEYGFIVRYQEGKEHITGYMAEPWHIRYLGVDLATKVYNSGLTLEEYLGVSYGDY